MGRQDRGKGEGAERKMGSKRRERGKENREGKKMRGCSEKWGVRMWERK